VVNLNLPEIHIPIGMEDNLERLDLAQNGAEQLRMRAGYSAVDLVGHVNNSRYVEWICDAFPIRLFTEKRLSSLQINYEHEVLPGEEVSILVNTVDGDANRFAIEGRNLSKDTRAFEALLCWKP
jgi:acyl-ACP thioesterase